MAGEFTNTQDINALSEWFMTSLEANPLPLDHLLGVVDSLPRQNRLDLAREWCDLLRDQVLARADAPGLVRVLEAGARQAEDPRGYRKDARDWMARLLKERLELAMLEASGFEADLAPAECLRRLRVLMGLREGAFCLDKTWGFGVVRRVDEFYKKVTIDFTRKPGHTMSFAYAGEALQLVGAEHLLARKHTNPDELLALGRDQADEVVRVALRSFGPLTVVQLQEIISGEGLDGGDWKAFWDRARKTLKDDGMIEIPTRRSEPLRVLTTRRAYDETWYSALQKERDPKRIYERVLALEKSGTAASAPAESRQTVAERISFSIRGADTKHPDLAARLLMVADRLGLGDAGVDIVATAQHLAQPARLLRCMDLPAREVDLLLQLLERTLPDAAERLGRLLPRLPVHATHVVLDSLRSAGKTEAVATMIRDGLLDQSVSPEVLDYLCAHQDLVPAWSLGSLADILHQVVGALEVDASGERYRTQKSLRERFEDRGWLEVTLNKLHERGRSQLLSRIRQSRAWDESSKRSLMGRMIKLYPELEGVVARADKKAEGPAEQRFTSWRTYRERQEQLRVIREVSIPENSKEIGHARSYGDLRENFEYQAARDQQRLLMRREAELERDLGEVRGSDFGGIGTDRVSMGTGVRLLRPSGETQQYWVLGEWDRDETLNIISNKSELAKRMEGATPGAEIDMPGDAAGQRTRVLEVLPLTDDVKAWARGPA